MHKIKILIISLMILFMNIKNVKAIDYDSNINSINNPISSNKDGIFLSNIKFDIYDYADTKQVGFMGEIENKNSNEMELKFETYYYDNNNDIVCQDVKSLLVPAKSEIYYNLHSTLIDLNCKHSDITNYRFTYSIISGISDYVDNVLANDNFNSNSQITHNVDVYTRTEEDYLVPPDIVVTNSNKNNVLNTPAVDAEKKVYDFADLLTDSEEKSLYDEINKYIEVSKYDLAVVTIDENPKYSAMIYADDFFDYNDFGIGVNRNGALILIDMDTREIWISTSGEAIDKYNSTRIESILDAGYDELTSANYDECLMNMVKKLESYHRMPYFVITLISLIICLIVSAVLYNKTRSVIKKHNTATYINADTTNIIKNDMFITTHTSRVLRQSSSSSGGGGGSHRSSSGRSHGGGGRRF